ncbi:hypothetical protein SUGI_0329500 [Cryptomeria japonica]|nr:hypothetical protein SUGI_0329500 [Cryptomeria japonica]
MKCSPCLSARCKVNWAKVKWRYPKAFRWKLNFDGTTKGNPSRGRVGYVIRDSEGNFIQGASKKLIECTNNEVEIEALAIGIELCLKLDIHGVKIEGDSLLCIRAITSGGNPNWHLRKWVDYIGGLLDRLGNYSLNHIYREAYKTADCVANQAVVQDMVITEDSNPKAWSSLPTLINMEMGAEA